jgi:PAS domain S-box-containing protein
MDFKEKYKELLKVNKKIEKELEYYRLQSIGTSRNSGDVIFKVFHSASYLMAISKLDTGQFADVNGTFLKTLGYRKEEVIGHSHDDLQIFADIEEAGKYIKLISKLEKIKDYPLVLKSKTDEKIPCLFSADVVLLDDKKFLLTIFDELNNSPDPMIRKSRGSVLNEIFETVSSYLTLYSVSGDGKFYVVDLSTKVEEVELIWKSEVLNRCIDDTPLARRVKLVELLNYLRITGIAHKLAASPDGDDSEGYYMGFVLSTGNIVITWESGKQHNNKDDSGESGSVSQGSSEMITESISDHKENANQIKTEKAFLENLIESTPEAIAIIDTSGKIFLINKEFTNLFDYTSEEVIGRPINDTIVPEDLQEEALNIDKLASQKLKEVRETIRKDKHGNKIQVLIIVTAIVVENRIVAFMGIYRDITIEKKTQLLQEILYNISTEALKLYDVKEIYPIIVKQLGKIWNTDNFFIALYDNSTDTLSFPFFEDEKDSFHEISAKKTLTGWVIRNNKSVLLKEDEINLLDESGEIELFGTPCKVWMGVPLKVENDTIGVMCLQDYNDENKFTNDDLYLLDFIANHVAVAIHREIILDNLIQARRKAEDAAQATNFFMSTMSHEIRTPLNEVIGITNLLLQGNPGEDQIDYLKTLKFSGNHLLTLVNDVLDYNKIESGKIAFEKTQFNFGDFLDDIMRSYSFRSKTKNLSFEIIKSNDLPAEVIGDPIRLNQILSNLLSNALKFTNTGGITLTVKELARTNNQSNLEFVVSDTGIGIPKDKHQIIFERFTQASTDTTRKFGGTGLGLTICKRLIELQGGTISLESEPGKGSSFRFDISINVSDNDPRTQNAEMPDEYIGLEGKNILVAEDNKINYFVVNKFLVGWGASVTHAEDGQSVLDLLENEDFDLILMDLHMPGMDGIEAIRIIRKSEDPKIRNIPIVALTAAIMFDSKFENEDLNVNGYILKPFKPRDLFEQIRKHIR